MEPLHCLLSEASKVTPSLRLEPGGSITHAEDFIGQDWNWCISLLLTFHCPDLSYKATPDCSRGEEEEGNTDFV